MRSVPMGKYMQPSGNWEDGLDIPFTYVRDENYVRVHIGALANAEPLGLDMSTARDYLQFELDGVKGKSKQPLQFHADSPFVESITFVMPPSSGTADYKLVISAVDNAFASSKLSLIHI